jgi:hypothetical protein
MKRHNPEEIVRHPARHHSHRLIREGCEIISAIANLVSQQGGPDRCYLHPGRRVGTDELDQKPEDRTMQSDECVP